MLLNPYRFGGGGGGLLPLPSQTISFIAGSYLNQTNATNSRSIVIPGSTAIGDLMIATIYHAATITAPSGWTQYFNEAAGGSRLSVWAKTAASGDSGASRTWTQSASANFTVHYTIVRGDSPLSIKGNATASGTSSDTSIAIPESSPTNRGQFLIAVAARTSSSADFPATAGLSAGWTTRSVTSETSLPIRLLLGTRTATSVTDVSGTFSFSPGASSPSWRTVQLLIGYT